MICIPGGIYKNNYKIVPKVLWNEFLILIDFFFLIFRSLFDIFICSTFRRFDRMMVVHVDFRFFRGFISSRRGIRSSFSSERSIWITVFLWWRSGIKFWGTIGFWAIKYVKPHRKIAITSIWMLQIQVWKKGCDRDSRATAYHDVDLQAEKL